MRALRLEAVGRFDWVTLPDPPPAAGEVVVRPAAIAICGSDLSAYRGVHPRIAPPVVLGHELAGTVEALGEGVDDRWLGARVAVEPTAGCGRCRACQAGRENVCAGYTVIGESSDRPGGFAELVVVPREKAHPLPDGISFEEAAVAQPMAIGVHAVQDRAAVASGETVAVVGLGAIGLAAQLAAIAAGGRVVAVEPRAFRRALAERLGADVAVDPATARGAVAAVTDGYGADVVIEAAGGTNHEPIEIALSLLAPGGRLVLLGSYATPTVELDFGRVKTAELDIRGAQAHPGTFPSAIRGMSDGTFAAAAMITHRLPLADAPGAFALLADPSAELGKVVLLPPG